MLFGPAESEGQEDKAKEAGGWQRQSCGLGVIL